MGNVRTEGRVTTLLLHTSEVNNAAAPHKERDDKNSSFFTYTE